MNCLVVDMEKSRLKLVENPYCYVSSSGNDRVIDEKIDELLLRVKRIESTLFDINNKPIPPPKPFKIHGKLNY